MISSDSFPTLIQISEAHERIAPFVHHTPVFTNESINEIVGAELYFKCENLQKVGAFKARGATNAVLQLSEEELSKGVCTHSSGNHAQAVALAGRDRGAKAYIVMPTSAPKVKVAAVKGYGAEVIFCEPTLEARETTLQAVVERTGATFIHPYNNFNIITGAATVAKELIEDHDFKFDAIMAPVGGGGLMSGTALSTAYLSPGTKIYGAEPAGADDAFRSFKSGTLVPSINPQTISDGLLTSLGEKTFAIILDKVDDIFTVEEETIVRAMRLIWERMKLVIEPSSAVPLAVLLENKFPHKGQKIGILISGGNVDLGKLPFKG